MSGILVTDEESWLTSSEFGTRDVMLAATLATLGFEFRHKQPLMLTFNGNLVAKALIDKNYGTVEELAECTFVFVLSTKHPLLGDIDCSQIECAHKLAGLLQEQDIQEQEVGYANQQLQARIERARTLCNRKQVSKSMLEFVKSLLDQISNFHQICEAVNKLANDPFIKFTKRMRKGLQHAINPLETESTTMKRAEKFMTN